MECGSLLPLSLSGIHYRAESGGKPPHSIFPARTYGLVISAFPHHFESHPVIHVPQLKGWERAIIPGHTVRNYLFLLYYF